MDRSYLILWFAVAFFLVLIAFGIYGKLTRPPAAAPATAPATQPLVDRLREERERRMREREGTVVPVTNPATRPAID